MHLALACAAIVAAGDLPDLIVVPIDGTNSDLILSHHAVGDGEVFVVSGTTTDLVRQSAYWHPQPGEEVFIYSAAPDPTLTKTIRAHTFGVVRCVSEQLLPAKIYYALPSATDYSSRSEIGKAESH